VRRRWSAPVKEPTARINEEIRVSEVRLINQEGKQVGLVPLAEALKAAEEAGLDLVEVAPDASPPVCRILDFGKYKYRQAKRQKEARHKQKAIGLKQVKFRPKIDEHDYQFKFRNVEKFLQAGNRCKLTIMFRGREMTHPELGRKILNRVAREAAEYATIEIPSKLEGRNMTMTLVPKST